MDEEDRISYVELMRESAGATYSMEAYNKISVLKWSFMRSRLDWINETALAEINSRKVEGTLALGMISQLMLDLGGLSFKEIDYRVSARTMELIMYEADIRFSILNHEWAMLTRASYIAVGLWDEESLMKVRELHEENKAVNSARSTVVIYKRGKTASISSPSGNARGRVKRTRVDLGEDKVVLSQVVAKVKGNAARTEVDKTNKLREKHKVPKVSEKKASNKNVLATMFRDTPWMPSRKSLGKRKAVS